MNKKNLIFLAVGICVSLCALAISPQHASDVQHILKFKESIQNKKYDQIIDFFLKHSNTMSSLYSVQKALFLTRDVPIKYLTRYTSKTDVKPDMIFFNIIHDQMRWDARFTVWVDFAYKEKMPENTKVNLNFLDYNKTITEFEDGHSYLEYKEKMFNIGEYITLNPIGLITLQWGDRRRDNYDNQYHIVFNTLPRWYYFIHDHLNFKYQNGNIVIHSTLTDKTVGKGKMLIQSNLGFLNRKHSYHTIEYENIDDLNSKLKKFVHKCDNRCNEVNLMTIYNVIEINDAPIPVIVTHKYDFKVR
jgi:hypothetical protein